MGPARNFLLSLLLFGAVGCGGSTVVREQVYEVKENARALEIRVTELGSKVAKLEKELGASKAGDAGTARDLERVKETIRRTAEEVRALRVEFAQSVDQVAGGLKGELQRVKKEAAVGAASRKELERRLSETEKKLEALSGKTKEIDRLGAELNSLKDGLKLALSRIESLAGENAGLKKSLSDLRSLVASETAQLKKALGERAKKEPGAPSEKQKGGEAPKK